MLAEQDLSDTEDLVNVIVKNIYLLREFMSEDDIIEVKRKHKDFLGSKL